MINNTLVVEYNFTFQRREAGAENAVTVQTKDGTTKTVPADGQDSFQYFAIQSASDCSFGRLSLLGGEGRANTVRVLNAAGTKTEYKNMMTSHGDVPTNPDVPKISFEYRNDLYNTSTSTPYDTLGTQYDNICDIEHSFKCIFDSVTGQMDVYVDDLLIYATTASWRDDWRTGGWATQFMKNYLKLVAKPGVDILLDDLKIYEYVPALEITEMMVNGTSENAAGAYQWVELTNFTDGDVNVYDYALHGFNMPNNTATAQDTIGNELQNYKPGDGSTIGYFTPGDRTLANGEIFTSPAYADGVLESGESAIVLIPDTAMADTKNSVTDEAFKTYLTGLGMDANVKVFVCDNSSENPFTLGNLTNESLMMGIMKVENTATDGGYTPVAIGANQDVMYMYSYMESYTFVTSKSIGSGGNYLQLGVVSQGKALPSIALNGKLDQTGDQSFEVTNANWESDGSYSMLGFMCCNANATRKNAAGNDVYATPGYVPTANMRNIDVKVTTDGTVSTVGGKLWRDSSVTVTAPAAQQYYVIHQYVNGVLVNDNVTAESEVTVNFTAAQMTHASANTIEFVYYTAEPMMCRARLSETGTIQLIAGVNDLDLATETVLHRVRRSIR